MFQQYLYTIRPLALLFTLCMLFTAGTAFANENKQLLIVGAPPEGWPPFTIVGQPALGDGIMTDVIKNAIETYGHTMDLAIFPEKRSRLLLREGALQAYPKAQEWVSNPNEYDWTDPVVMSSDILIFSKKRHPQAPPTQLTGLNVGVILGFQYPVLTPLFKNKTINRCDAKSTESLLRMLQRGHIDAAVTNSIVADWIIKNNADLKTSDFIFQEEPIDSAPYRFAITKAADLSGFIAHFNSVLAAMKKDGRLQAILNKYK